jgi:hypothetical protein
VVGLRPFALALQLIEQLADPWTSPGSVDTGLLGD